MVAQQKLVSPLQKNTCRERIFFVQILQINIMPSREKLGRIQFKKKFYQKNDKFKGGLILECIFTSVPFSKKIYKIYDVTAIVLCNSSTIKNQSLTNLKFPNRTTYIYLEFLRDCQFRQNNVPINLIVLSWIFKLHMFCEGHKI